MSFNSVARALKDFDLIEEAIINNPDEDAMIHKGNVLPRLEKEVVSPFGSKYLRNTAPVHIQWKYRRFSNDFDIFDWIVWSEVPKVRMTASKNREQFTRDTTYPA